MWNLFKYMLNSENLIITIDVIVPIVHILLKDLTIQSYHMILC